MMSQKENIVMWQHKYYVPLALLMNLGMPILLGIIYNDIVGMLLMIGAVRFSTKPPHHLLH